MDCPMAIDPEKYPSWGGIREVVMIEGVFEQFVEWADSRGWDLFLMPIEDSEIPAYAISPRSLRKGP